MEGTIKFKDMIDKKDSEKVEPVICNQKRSGARCAACPHGKEHNPILSGSGSCADKYIDCCPNMSGQNPIVVRTKCTPAKSEC